MEHVVVKVRSSFLTEVLQAFERKNFRVVALKAANGMASVAVSAPSAIAEGARLVAHLKGVLPFAELYASSTLEEALDLMHSTFAAREVVQWEPSDDADECSAISPLGAPLQGAQNSREAFWLQELLQPGAVGGDLGRRFCAQLRRDSYVPLLMPPEGHALYAAVESAASRWFAQVAGMLI